MTASDCQPALIVLTFHWEQQDGLQRQETYGPWVMDEDEAYLADVQVFIRQWPRLAGARPQAVVMSRLTDPGGWTAAHGSQSTSPIAPLSAPDAASREPRTWAYPYGMGKGHR